MATGTDDDDPPSLTESYATASYVTDVEDGPQTLDVVPILTPDVDSDSGPSGAVCPGDVLACPDGSVVSREIVDGGCNFAPCPDRAYPVGTAGGHFFPVWGGGRKCRMRRRRAPAKLGVGRVPQGDEVRLLRGLLHAES